MGLKEETSGISRRSYLGVVGAATTSTAVVGTVNAANEDDYGTVVDIVEAGADNTGEEPIDDVFHDVAEDDTMVKFPDGTYLVNQLIVYRLTDFAMVGEGDATLVPGDAYEEEQWIAGAETRNFRVENFTIDTTEDGVSPEIDVSAWDGLVVRNVRKVGYQDDGGCALAFHTLADDGRGLVENVRATDGGESVGLYIESDGPMTVRNCRFENFADNGVYASAGSAPVVVEGGLFRNNNVAQVRLGCADSVLRDAELVVDERVAGPDGGPVNMRGVRVADGPGPVTVENCDITLTNSQGSGGVVGAYSGGSFTVRNTRIYVGDDYTTVGSYGNDASYGIFVDDATQAETGQRRVESTAITGGGASHGAMLFRRSNNTLRDLCIEQTGEGRDGIIFEDSSNNELADAGIDVPGRPVVLRNSSVKRSNVRTSATCPEPGDSGGSDGSASGLQGEMGTLSHQQSAGGEWTTVGFDRTVEDPVVFSNPVSHRAPQPCHVRVRDVRPAGFDFQFEEWMYTDGWHKEESAAYIALGTGTYGTATLPMEVGRTETDHEFGRVEFSAAFDEPPVVLAQSQTRTGTDPIVTRLQNVSADGVDVRLQEEEGEEHDGYHYEESVGYLAIQPGSGSLGDRPFEVDRTGAGVDESWYRIEFDGSYEEPLFFASLQTFNGPNTANLRYRNLTGSSVEVTIEEERSEDREVGHRYERVGYAVVESA